MNSEMLMFLALAVVVLVAAIWLILRRVIRSRNMQYWLKQYMLTTHQRRSNEQGTTHILFCFVDHFEPKWHDPSPEVALQRVQTWCTKYRRLASKYTDADGCHPKHTFFFPEEEYEPEYLDLLRQLCADGYGEVEVHLHHDEDTEENLTRTLSDFVETLHTQHGLLGRDRAGNLRWGFIHGNWSLDNSDPQGRWCGVNNEVRLLPEIGCYADFTLPSAPSSAQTSTINSIYYATNRPNRPKSHDTGTPVRVGADQQGDLMIVQGPLCIEWNGLTALPKIENADVRMAQPPSEKRMENWLRCNICVDGRPDWKVVKVHTHGAQEQDMPTLLGEPMDDFFEALTTQYNDGSKYVLHFVSARELYNIIKAAEADEQGSPGDFRDYLISPPSFVGKP